LLLLLVFGFTRGWLGFILFGRRLHIGWVSKTRLRTAGLLRLGGGLLLDLGRRRLLFGGFFPLLAHVPECLREALRVDLREPFRGSLSPGGCISLSPRRLLNFWRVGTRYRLPFLFNLTPFLGLFFSLVFGVKQVIHPTGGVFLRVFGRCGVIVVHH
jgi:hypothetical protein